jgi:methionyl-tRNA formyltransferase
MYSIIFFGSFQSFSNQVLQKLLNHPDLFRVTSVVTTPPRPAGRDQKLTPTETQTFSEEKNIPVFPLENLDNKSPRSLTDIPDFIVVAGYGKLIPPMWLEFPKAAPINVHFSLLPNYPGRFPAEWAILMGEVETGVTIIKMSPEFDKGEIITQEKLPIAPSDTRETVYKKLYDLGGDLAVKVLPLFASGKIKAASQSRTTSPKYARQITREDGFVPLEFLQKALKGEAFEKSTPLLTEVIKYKRDKRINAAEFIDRILRAFDPWPGVWTVLPDNRRLKILKGHLEKPLDFKFQISNFKLVVDSLQLEGRSPITCRDAQNFLSSQ